MVPQHAHASRERVALTEGLYRIAVVARRVDKRPEAEDGRALGEEARFVDVVTQEIDEDRRASDGGAKAGAGEVVAIVALHVDERGEPAHGDVASFVGIVTRQVDGDRDPSGRHRSALVDVVAARVDDQRRSRAITVARDAADDDAPERRIALAGRWQSHPGRAQRAGEARGRL